MFVKRDLRKIGEILADEEDPREELKLARRQAEFGGSLRVLCRPAALPRLSGLRRLSLYDDALTSVEGIGLLRATPLEELNLGRNLLAALPAELGELQSLRRLWLDDNQLAAFPAPLLRLRGLVELRLSGNRLEALPAELGEALPELETLAADGNQLTALPASLGALAGSLTSLVVRGNAIAELPAEVCALGRLELLCASSNRLRALPAGLAGLRSLQTLLVNANALEALPLDELRALPALRKLNVANNHLSGPYLSPEADWGEVAVTEHGQTPPAVVPASRPAPEGAGASPSKRARVGDGGSEDEPVPMEP